MTENKRGGYVVQHTRAGFHISINGNNSEPIVDGEVLKTRDAARTAIVAIGRLHSPTGDAYLRMNDTELVLHGWGGADHHIIDVVWRDDRVPSRTERVITALTKRIIGPPSGVQARIDTGYPVLLSPGEAPAHVVRMYGRELADKLNEPAPRNGDSHDA